LIDMAGRQAGRQAGREWCSCPPYLHFTWGFALYRKTGCALLVLRGTCMAAAMVREKVERKERD
jgi:hypothetical protein